MSTETPWPTPLPSPHPDDRSQLPLSRRPDIRVDAAAFAVVAGASVALAFGVGALWRSFAPAVVGVVSQGGVYYSAPESETFVARDGWFALFACIAAVLLALGSFARYRRGGSVGAALALAAGGIGGGYLAAWFGALIGPGRGSILRAAHSAANGTTFDLPVSIRATGVIWLWPAVAAGLFFFLMLLFGPSEPEAEQPAFPGWGEQHNGAAPGAYPSPYEVAAAAHSAHGAGNDSSSRSSSGDGSGNAASVDADQPPVSPREPGHRPQTPGSDQRSE